MRTFVGLSIPIFFLGLPSCATVPAAHRLGLTPFPQPSVTAEDTSWLPVLLLVFVAGLALGCLLVHVSRRLAVERALRNEGASPPAGEVRHLQLAVMLIEKVLAKVGPAAAPRAGESPKAVRRGPRL